jgi:hypothetical protein
MRFVFFVALLTLPVLLASCGDSIEREDTYGKTREQGSRYQYGSVLGGSGGLNILGEREDAKQKAAGGLGVNAFLWRASLDTLSFMPIASADPFGGTILTEWYAPSSTPNERIKLNVYILGRELRADAVRVSVFRQQKDSAGNWQDANTNIATAGTVEDAILTKARQLRLQQIAQTQKE